jgi:microcystin-dependent protein
LDDVIEAYLNGQPINNNYYAKMIPYTIMPYFGPLVGNFDATGAGLGVWQKIFLCNGLNATPDLRGVTLVGATTMGSNAFNSTVDPAISGNPTYANGQRNGANQITLTANQAPPHSHTATATVTDPGHVHHNTKQNPAKLASGIYNYDSVGDQDHFDVMDSDSAVTGVTVAVSVGTTGGGMPHANVQPSYGINYIIYIP